MAAIKRANPDKESDILLADNDYALYTAFKELKEAIRDLTGVLRGK